MRSSIKGISEQLKIFNGFDEVMKYKITENFPKYGERIYYLNNLCAEIERGGAYFYDEEQMIYKDDIRVLIGFRIKGVKCKHEWEQDKNWTCTLTLSGGTIVIERMSNIHN